MFMALYRAIAFCVVLGVLVALAAIACAVAVIAVFGAVVYGLASRTQTVGSALRALGVNVAAGVELVGALRPQRQNSSSS
jgi:hypothetical protein